MARSVSCVRREGGEEREGGDGGDDDCDCCCGNDSVASLAADDADVEGDMAVEAEEALVGGSANNPSARSAARKEMNASSWP